MSIRAKLQKKYCEFKELEWVGELQLVLINFFRTVIQQSRARLCQCIWVFYCIPSTEKYESLSEKLSSRSTIEDESEDTCSIHSIDDSQRKLILPTMWLGLQTGILKVHSSLDDWKTPIRTLDLGDCILCIVWVCNPMYYASQIPDHVAEHFTISALTD